jgi:predicted RND superfamily exporter protein
MAKLVDIMADVDKDGLLGKRAYVVSGQAFTWIMTEVALVANVIQGFAICFPACFIVLVLATGSPLISLYAIATIALIVAVTLGFCQGIMGWGLGVAETVSSTIVIGFSVDYVVHLGHSYRESTHSSREGKTSDALTKMGITVIAGAITTFGSGIFMFACQMTFFTKMATLIVLVISSSIIYALCFFMPLCALAGPQGKMLTLSEYAQQASAFCRERRNGRDDRQSVGAAAIAAAPAEATLPTKGPVKGVVGVSGKS